MKSAENAALNNCEPLQLSSFLFFFPKVVNIVYENTNLAPVVQTLDSAIHRINHYPADKY